MRKVLVALGLSFLAGAVHGADLPSDPLKSGLWESIARQFLDGGDIVFDQRVKVFAPRFAEDQFAVPVTVDASAFPDVVEIVVIADMNPIQKALSFRPVDAAPFIGTRIKLEQTSPVRAAVRTSDGTWHVGGAIVEAAGGGCTAPAVAHGTANWMATLGETQAKAHRQPDGEVRITMRMRHPMDTGLAAGIPVFYLSNLAVTGEGGAVIADLDLFEPVSENPTVTLKADAGPAATTLDVSGRDTEGHRYAFALDVPASIAGN